MFKSMPFLFLLVFIFVAGRPVKGQNCGSKGGDTLSSCLQIERILVDACATPEGANEMMTIRTGPFPIPVSLLQVTWPNNPWRGFASEAASATVIAALQSEIQQCGRISYPPMGVIPPHSRVLIFCSLDYQVGSHSFANLQDSLYVLFQNAGNTAGHFANHGTGIRTTSVSLSNGFCAASANYDRAKLLRANGSAGAEDGASVYFPNGKPAVYENIGCTPPVSPFSLSLSASRYGVCKGDTVWLNANVAGTTCYRWSSPAVAIKDTLAAQTYFVTPANASGSFTVYFTAQHFCLAPRMDSLRFSFAALPTLNTPDSVTICDKDTLALTAKVTNGAFIEWSGPTVFVKGKEDTTCVVNVKQNQFSFYLYAAAENACGSIKDSTWIRRDTIARAILSASDTLFCEGKDSLFLQAFSAASSLAWTTLGLGFLGDKDQANAFYLPAPKEKGIVRFYLRSSTACVSRTDSLLVRIEEQPDASFSLDSLVCFTSLPLPLFPTRVGGDFSPFVNNNLFMPPSPGLYTIKHVLQNGPCVDSAFKAVRVYPSPTADFSATPLSIRVGDDVTFTNTSSGANQYAWRSENKTATTKDWSYRFSKDGRFTVVLTVRNDTTGCIDSAARIIEVFEELAFYIGNSFTPNGDSINDRFVGVANGDAQIEMWIFNRWGQQLCYTTDVTGYGWDGTYEGRPCPSGVYIYMVKLKGLRGENKEYTGTLHLLR